MCDALKVTGNGRTWHFIRFFFRQCWFQHHFYRPYRSHQILIFSLLQKKHFEDIHWPFGLWIWLALPRFHSMMFLHLLTSLLYWSKLRHALWYSLPILLWTPKLPHSLNYALQQHAVSLRPTQLWEIIPFLSQTNPLTYSKSSVAKSKRSGH